MAWTERAWLYNLLVCPNCGARLKTEPGELGCDHGHRFPIVGDIPRFTPPSSYADSFGFEWTTFPRLQLDTAANAESERTFRSKTGLESNNVRGKAVFDAGCGMGRFSHVVARWGAARVVGVDISRAVDAASENLEPFDSAALAQADLRQLPFAEGSFDIVFSIGVLHHTPSTFESLASIARLVKPGGTLAIWVYSRDLRWRRLGSEILRPLTSRVRPETLLKGVQRIVPLAAEAKHGFPVLAPAFNAILPTSSHPDPEWRILDTFDWYSLRYQWKHTFEEVEGWFRALGFVGVERR